MELTIAMSLLTLVSGAIYQTLEVSSRALHASEQRSSNVNEARSLIATCTKDIRTAVRLQAGTSPFIVADSREAIFYANLKPTLGPRKVHFYIDSTSQMVSEWTEPDSGSVAPNYTYNGSPNTRFVGRYVVNTSTQPIFQYFDALGNELANTPLGAADLLSIDEVKITLRIRQQTNLPVGEATVINRVRLPNVDYQATFD